MFQISDYFDSTLLDNFTSKNIFYKRWLIMFIHISYMLAPYSNTTFFQVFAFTAVRRCLIFSLNYFADWKIYLPSNLHNSFKFCSSHIPSPIHKLYLHFGFGFWLQGSAPQRTLQELVFSVNGWGVQNPCWHAALTEYVFPKWQWIKWIKQEANILLKEFSILYI